MIWWLLLCGLCFLVGRRSSRWRLVLPEHLVRGHRRIWRLWWRWKSRSRGGRPRIDADLIRLIRKISADNPLWGAPRIHGELIRLGYRVAQSTVSRYMLPRNGRPSQDWATFLRNHADAIVAIDMLCVPTIGFRRLYALIVLGHRRRAILHLGVTGHPTACWLAWQISLAFPDDPPAWLVRDNDRAYGLKFRRQIARMGIRDRPIRPHSPWENGHVERLIGSIRRECLDHVVVVNARHLQRLLDAYADYYNNDRTLLALEKDSPRSRPIERKGAIKSRPILGGLHRRYFRSREK